MTIQMILRAASVRRCAFLLCTALASVSQPLHAQVGPVDEEPGGSLLRGILTDKPDKAFEEIEPQLPATPQDTNLVSFYVSPTTTLKFALDRHSLTFDKDDVYRYTVVIDSPQGARNVRYEGIRCETYQTKLYATRDPQGGWKRSANRRWLRVVDASANRYQAALYKDWLCDGVAPAGKPEDIVRRMQRGESRAQRLTGNTGY